MKKKIPLTLIPLVLFACATIQRPKSEVPQSIEKIYAGSYDEIWQAALMVLDAYAYKFSISEKASGYIETDFIRGYSDKEFIYSGGQKFPKEIKWKLKLWLLALPSPEAQPRVRIKIEKEEYISGELLEGWQQKASDFLEEKKIFYRVERVRDLNRMVEGLTTPAE